LTDLSLFEIFCRSFQGTNFPGMKRKRGTKENGAHGKKNKKRVEEVVEEEESDQSNREEMDFDRSEESFEGFSTDEDEEMETHEGEEVKKPGATNGTSGPAKRKGKKSAPTQEELMEVMYRSSSFKSNLFKLQVDELLSEVQLKYDRMEKVEAFLFQLKEQLSKIPSTDEQLVSSTQYLSTDYSYTLLLRP